MLDRSACETAAMLRGYRFAFTNEDELQTAIAQVLSDRGVSFEREHRLSGADRIDFLIAGGLGIEVKIDGATNALLRQVNRYVQHDAIKALVVVVSRTRLAGLPTELGGKPIVAVSLLPGIG